VGEDELHARSLLGDRWKQDNQDEDTYIHSMYNVSMQSKQQALE
jgi:hypothetical protein